MSHNQTLFSKDSEKIHKLVGGRQEEAFNDKNNLKVDFISTKLNISKVVEAKSGGSKLSISKKEILQRIDEILNNPLNMYNEDIATSLKEKLRKKEKIFRILQTDREKLKRSQNKVLKKILKKKLDYERRHENMQAIIKCINETNNQDEKTAKGFINFICIKDIHFLFRIQYFQ